jgi:hypothetical protein
MEVFMGLILFSPPFLLWYIWYASRYMDGFFGFLTITLSAVMLVAEVIFSIALYHYWPHPAITYY